MKQDNNVIQSMVNALIDEAESRLDPHSEDYTQSIRVDIDENDIYIDAEITFKTDYYEEFNGRRIDAKLYSVFIYEGIMYDEDGRSDINWEDIDWGTNNVI